MIEKLTSKCCFAAECVIFDFDGTLCDSKGDIVATLQTVVEKYGFVMPEVDAVTIGPPLEIMIRQAVGDGVDQEIIKAMCVDYRTVYDASLFERSPLYPGALELIKQLKKHGIPLAIATNKREVATRLILARKKITSYFDLSLSSDTDGEKWLKERMIIHILEATNACAEESLFFGDTLGDILATQATGIPSVAALYGYGPVDELIHAKPDYICERLTDLLG